MTSLVVHVCFYFNDLNQMQKRKVSRIVASLAVSNCYNRYYEILYKKEVKTK